MNLNERRGGATLVYGGRPGPAGPQGVAGPPGGDGGGHLFREFTFANLDNPVEIGTIPAGFIAGSCSFIIKIGFPGTSFTVGTDEYQDMIMSVSDLVTNRTNIRNIAFIDKSIISTIKIFPSFAVPPGAGSAEAIIYYSKEKI